MKKIAIAIALVAFLFAGFIYYEKAADARSKAHLAALEAERQELVFQALTPEQRVEVGEYFRRALAYYVDGKPDLCLAALKDMHRYLHVFKNSADLEAKCEKSLAGSRAAAQ